MAENWMSHMVEGEDGGVYAILVDVAHADSMPDRKRPLWCMVRVPIKSPGDNGFGSDAERDVIFEMEDQFADHVRKIGGMYVASIRGCGNIGVHAYAPEGAGDRVAAAAKKCFAGYQIEYGDEPDPQWEQYKNILPSPAAAAAIADAQLIQALQDNGDQNEKARPVDHCIFVPKKKVEEAKSRARAAGYSFTDALDREDPVGLILTRSHSVTPDEIATRRAELERIAEALGGNYDGWETILVKK